MHLHRQSSDDDDEVYTCQLASNTIISQTDNRLNRQKFLKQIFHILHSHSNHQDHIAKKHTEERLRSKYIPSVYDSDARLVGLTATEVHQLGRHVIISSRIRNCKQMVYQQQSVL